jgi:asparagine synthase (glutamine-hydrolysing)
MCGITGFLSRHNGHTEQAVLVERMTRTLSHRGPDDSGVWVDPQAGVALGHTRLSIVDLSPAGHQPMVSHCGRYVIVYNGEAYNFAELRKELEQQGKTFRGHSDTEVVLEACAQWGVHRAVTRLIGMFAFALWDRQERTLTLVRDRLGIKPLYWGHFSRLVLFGSELKALRAHPGWLPTINRNALTLYLRYNYIPAPHTIYQNVFKLPPSTILTLDVERLQAKVPPAVYWSAREAAETGVADPFVDSTEEAIAQLENILSDAVRLRMIADVPLGAFLSGGVDSSVVVALMQAQSARPVRTFTIGFHEAAYNEAEDAKAVAQHLGTDHTELYATPEEAMAVIPQLPTLYDEPFADASQIPTFLVSQLARQHVTVSLSGDGGDELFTGYDRYFWAQTIWRRIGWAPIRLQRLMAKAPTALSPQSWDTLLRSLAPVLPEGWRARRRGEKLHKVAALLPVSSPEAMYLALMSHWKAPTSVVLDADEPPTAFADCSQWVHLPEHIQRTMLLDTLTYLPDDILTKVDRASMGVSLEARVPLLDHRVVEFAWRLPLSLKFRHGQGKWLLRQVLYKYVPKELIERPKMGFGVPIDAWLRGSLRDWAEALLDEKRLQKEGFFRPEPIQAKWTEHLSGRRNWQYHLWPVLMFQAWLEANS